MLCLAQWDVVMMGNVWNLNPPLKVQPPSPNLYVSLRLLSFHIWVFLYFFILQKELVVSKVWGFYSMIENLIIDTGEVNLLDMKLCSILWKGNLSHKEPWFPHRRVYLASETVNFHTWIALLIRKSLKIMEPSSPQKENEKRLAWKEV